MCRVPSTVSSRWLITQPCTTTGPLASGSIGAGQATRLQGSRTCGLRQRRRDGGCEHQGQDDSQQNGLPTNDAKSQGHEMPPSSGGIDSHSALVYSRGRGCVKGQLRKPRYAVQPASWCQPAIFGTSSSSSLAIERTFPPGYSKCPLCPQSFFSAAVRSSWEPRSVSSRLALPAAAARPGAARRQP